MYIFGGNDGVKGNNSVYAMNLRSYFWERIEGSAPEMDFHSAVVHNRKMIVFGGYIGGNLNNDIYTFDFVHLTWTLSEIQHKPSPRADHRCVVYENAMYLYGGRDNDSQLADL